MYQYGKPPDSALFPIAQRGLPFNRSGLTERCPSAHLSNMRTMRVACATSAADCATTFLDEVLGSSPRELADRFDEPLALVKLRVVIGIGRCAEHLVELRLLV